MSQRKSINSHLINPLSGWINRKHPLPERFYNDFFEDKPDPENWSTWVTIEESCLLHDVNNLDWTSLKDSINKSSKYLDECGKLINGLDGAWLDGEEQLDILDNIGLPPSNCLPIYFITVSNRKTENVVYIGKTKSNSRFQGGHSAAIKLHHPKYKNTIKKVYRASIWFHFNNEYIILDWIKPIDLALKILDIIESQLIYEFQPELNIKNKLSNSSQFEFTIHIQNSFDLFLQDKFVFPRK